jgi:hypothetical protein
MNAILLGLLVLFVVLTLVFWFGGKFDHEIMAEEKRNRPKRYHWKE